MKLFSDNNQEFQEFIDSMETIVSNISGYAKEDELKGLKSLLITLN